MSQAWRTGGERRVKLRASMTTDRSKTAALITVDLTKNAAGISPPG